jgi:hypothetical protein
MYSDSRGIPQKESRMLSVKGDQNRIRLGEHMTQDAQPINPPSESYSLNSFANLLLYYST